MARWMGILALAGCGAETWIEQIGVNEVMNGDPAGDWVELHNVTDGTVSLEGWSLEVDGAPMDLEGEVAAGAFLAVDVDLPDGGGTITIWDGTSTAVDDVGFPESGAEETFGRMPDAAPNWQRLSMPTPGEANRR